MFTEHCLTSIGRFEKLPEITTHEPPNQICLLEGALKTLRYQGVDLRLLIS